LPARYTPNVSSGNPGAAVKSSTTPEWFVEFDGGLTAAEPMPRLENAFQRICESLGFAYAFAALAAAITPSRACVKVGLVGVIFIPSM
jgi:hypothetical protein